MEARNSPDEEKDDSPSQENIGRLQSLKRDVESLEDFEDITKDVPSMRDVTAQFLQYETGDRNEVKSNESFFQPDYHLDFEAKGSERLPTHLPANPSNFEVNQIREDEYSDHLQPFKQPSERFSDIPERISDDSFGVVPNFEEKSEGEGMDYFQTEPNKGTQPLLNILDENKLMDILSNDEISTGSEDLSFIPKKGESSPIVYSDFEKDNMKKPISECKSNEMTDLTFNSQVLSQFPSEPGLSREQEPEGVQGDGLHVKENFEADVSDNDDLIPEPIPKDYPEIGAIEGKQFLAAIGLDTWFHPDLLNPKLESLVYWRDPKKSGIVFGSILLILLSLTSFSLISVVAYTSLIVLAAALAFRIYKNVLQAVQKTSEGHPFKAYLLTILNHPIITAVFLTIKEYLEFDLTLNPEKAREMSDVVVSYMNKAVSESRRLFLVEDVIDSIKFGILLWCLTYVGAWFNGLSLIIIAFVGLFTLPKVYENNKTQIDANIDIVKTKINEVTEKIKAVIPMGKKTEEVKDKGE